MIHLLALPLYAFLAAQSAYQPAPLLQKAARATTGKGAFSGYSTNEDQAFKSLLAESYG